MNSTQLYQQMQSSFGKQSNLDADEGPLSAADFADVESEETPTASLNNLTTAAALSAASVVAASTLSQSSSPTSNPAPKFTRKFTKSAYSSSSSESSVAHKSSSTEKSTPIVESETSSGTIQKSQNSRAVDGLTWQKKKLDWARKHEKIHNDAMTRIRSKKGKMNEVSFFLKCRMLIVL